MMFFRLILLPLVVHVAIETSGETVELLGGIGTVATGDSSPNLHLHRSYNMTHKVFVYGTLKRNEPNHHWLTKPEHGEGTFIDVGLTKTKYPLVIATKYNIPFILQSPGNGNQIKGEIYEVNDLMLSNLDILEDHPNYYVREIDDIIMSKTNEIVKCWIYFLKNFKQNLLSLPQFAEYSSNGSHGLKYMERFQRDPNYNYKLETKDYTPK